MQPKRQGKQPQLHQAEHSIVSVRVLCGADHETAGQGGPVDPQEGLHGGEAVIIRQHELLAVRGMGPGPLGHGQTRFLSNFILVNRIFHFHLHFHPG